MDSYKLRSSLILKNFTFKKNDIKEDKEEVKREETIVKFGGKFTKKRPRKFEVFLF